MNRRTFSQLTTLSGFGLSTNSLWPQIRNSGETYQYNLNYAPEALKDLMNRKTTGSIVFTL